MVDDVFFVMDLREFTPSLMAFLVVGGKVWLGSWAKWSQFGSQPSHESNPAMTYISQASLKVIDCHHLDVSRDDEMDDGLKAPRRDQLIEELN
jgi:hypothetical protein